MRKLFIILFLAVLPIIVTQECFAQYWDSYQLPAGATNGAFEVVDFDADDDLDVVGMSVWLNFAINELPDDWVFIEDQEIPPDGMFWDGELHDADNDGDLDIYYYGTSNGAHLGWIENLGDWEFEAHVIAEFETGGPGPTLSAGDIEGDGDIDIVLTRDTEGYSGLSVWYGDGEGGYDAYTLEDDSRYNVSDLVDLNGDSLLDFVVASNDGLYLFLSLDPPEFEQALLPDYTHSFGRSDIGDFDGDGDLDIANYRRPDIDDEQWDGALIWWENDGAGNFTAHEVWNSWTNFYQCNPKMFDMDNDSDTDIAFRHYIFINAGDNATFEQYQYTDVFPGTTPHVEAADIDGDGDIDLLNQEVRWYENPYIGPNLYPFHLLFPASGSQSLSPEVQLVWSPTTDYYGSEVDYEIYIASDQPDDFELVGESDDTTYTFTGEPGIDYFWRVKAVSSLEAERWAEELDWSFSILGNSVPSNTMQGEIPKRFAIESIYPNPFNSSTTVTVALPVSSDLTVTVYDLTGRKIATLADGSFAPGVHTFTFNASGLPSGMYFVQGNASGARSALRKILLLK